MFKKFGQRKHKSYEEIRYSCSVRFLDDTEPLTVVYDKESNGQWMLDHVCSKLNLLERDYFGLRYVDTDKQRHWLDPLKPVCKQMKRVYPFVLCFRVKFYPTDPAKLKEEITRYFLFLQLRRDLHHGRLLCSAQDSNLLAAYIVQSEVGDYDSEVHQAGYISKFKMLPKQTNKQEEKIAEDHRKLVGKNPSEVENLFLQKASALDTYGVDPHPVKDQKGNQMYLGVTHLGIVTFQGNKRTHLFKWPQITKIAFEGKMFIVHVIIGEDEELFEGPKKKNKKHACGFKCASFAACKHLWKCANEQQYFFTLDNASAAPRVTSGGGLFTRGSKFRFSGRCQKEVYADSENLNRPQPSFLRSCSIPHLSKKKKSESMPCGFVENHITSEATSLCDSVDSLRAAGETSFLSNGNLSTVSLESGLPPSEAVIVAETGYNPYLTLPRGGGHSREDILPITEEDDQQLTSESLPLYNTTQEDESKEGDEGEGSSSSVGDTRDDGLDGSGDGLTFVAKTEPILAGTLPKDGSGDPESLLLNEEAKTDGLGTKDDISPQPPPTETAPKKSWGKVIATVTIALLLSLTVLAVLVLETDLDLPLLRQLRQLPVVTDFQRQTYQPVRKSITSLWQ